MNRVQLERAVVQPYRFIGVPSSPEAKCLREHVIRFPSPTSERQFENIVHLMPTPGGRFLVTASTSGWVIAWDLGAGTGSLADARPKLVTSGKLDGTPNAFMVVPIEVDMTFRVVAGSSADGVGERCVAVSVALKKLAQRL